MPRLDFSDELDQELEKFLPPHFQGPRKAALRVEHVISEWLREHRRMALPAVPPAESSEVKTA